MKHIYKYSLEASFFKLITSPNRITKSDIEGVPTIVWEEDDVTVNTWTYETEEQRDNDYTVVTSYY